MNRYTCDGFNAVKAESMHEAAEIFATRTARQEYGRSAYCRTCKLNGHSLNGDRGYSTGQHETTGHNIHLIVDRE